MELTKEKREKYSSAKLEKEYLYGALANALKVIDRNMKEFKGMFPGPATVNNMYHLDKNGGAVDDWTSGFWTGMLWLAYELSLDEKYLKEARAHLRSYESRINNKIAVNHHDLGFLYTPSMVAQYKITGNERAKISAINAAKHLCSRFQEKGEFIQAWGDLGAKDNYRLIIDCNLNVPLLFWASSVTSDNSYAEIARKHLNTAADNVVRENGTTFHTFYFTEDGKPLKGVTAQGKSDDSTWARGQAWGVYGFALAYGYMKDEKFKKLYKTVTNVFLNKLPENDVCYWDLDFVPEDMEERDTSSIAIAICGILEMNKYLDDNDPDKKVYYNAALKMTKALIENYTTKDLENANGLLKEAVYSKPHQNGVNESCLWGDYFYMEALARLMKDNWNMYW